MALPTDKPRPRWRSPVTVEPSAGATCNAPSSMVFAEVRKASGPEPSAFSSCFAPGMRQHDQQHQHPHPTRNHE